MRGRVDRGEIEGIVAKARIIGMNIESVGCLTLIYDSYSKQMDIICDDDIKMDTGRYLFLNSGYKSIKFSNVDTSEVMDMVGMFSGCHKLEELDIACININKLRLAGDMFTGAEIGRLVINEIDKSKLNINNITIGKACEV